MSPVIINRVKWCKIRSLTSHTHTHTHTPTYTHTHMERSWQHVVLSLSWAWYAAFQQFSLHFRWKYACRTILFLIQVNDFWKINPKKCVIWWQKSCIFLPILLWIRHLCEGKMMASWWGWCQMNDVMIARWNSWTPCLHHVLPFVKYRH